MKTYSEREIIRILRNNGYEYLKTNGSHSKFYNGENTIIVTTGRSKPPNKMIFQKMVKEYGLEV